MGKKVTAKQSIIHDELLSMSDEFAEFNTVVC